MQSAGNMGRVEGFYIEKICKFIRVRVAEPVVSRYIKTLGVVDG